MLTGSDSSPDLPLAGYENATLECEGYVVYCVLATVIGAYRSADMGEGVVGSPRVERL